MKDKLFDNFEMYFPLIAVKAVRYYKSGDDDLIVILEDGDRVLYDDFDKTLRNLPKHSNRMTEVECRNEFGKRLNKIMRRKGVTQLELAKMTGITQPLISSYVNCRSMPGFHKVDKIAKALKCSVDDFRYV